MKISEQLLAFEAALAPFCATQGGDAKVASDPVNLFELLAEKPGSLRVAILFNTEDKRGEYEESGGVDRHFLFVITRAKGLTLNPADSLIRGAAGGMPMFDLVENVRDTVRGLTIVSADNPDTEGTPNYLGAKPYVTPNGILTDAMQLEFALGCQLPAATPAA